MRGPARGRERCARRSVPVYKETEGVKRHGACRRNRARRPAPRRRNNRYQLEIPVVAMGAASRAIRAEKRELFTEETETVLVFEVAAA